MKSIYKEVGIFFVAVFITGLLLQVGFIYYVLSNTEFIYYVRNEWRSIVFDLIESNIVFDSNFIFYKITFSKVW